MKLRELEIVGESQAKPNFANQAVTVFKIFSPTGVVHKDK